MANQTVINAEPGKHDYFVIREFDAPRELVFQAFTDPELVVKWLGPRRLKMTIEKYESKNGGAYRYVQEDTNGCLSILQERGLWKLLRGCRLESWSASFLTVVTIAAA